MISILFPVLSDRVDHVKLALDSLFDQEQWPDSWTAVDVLMVDDGNQEPVASLLRHFDGHKQSHVSSRLVARHERPMGVPKCLNLALDFAEEAEFVARMDSDDVCSPDRLSRQVQFLKTHPDVDVVGTCGHLVTGDSLTTTTTTTTTAKPLNLPTGCGAVLFAMQFQCVLIHPSVMFRRRQQQPPFIRYNDRVHFVEDYDLWLNGGLKMDNLPSHLIQLRKHDRAVSRRHRTEQQTAARQLSVTRIRQLTDNKFTEPECRMLLDHLHHSSLDNMTVDCLKVNVEILTEVQDCLIRNANRYSLSEKDQIKIECSKRIGELCTLALQRSPHPDIFKLMLSHNCEMQLSQLINNDDSGNDDGAGHPDKQKRSNVAIARQTAVAVDQLPCVTLNGPTGPTSSSRRVIVICFSKDRPWQLSEYLRSLKLFTAGATDTDQQAIELSVTVIACVTEPFALAYEQLFRECGELWPVVQFLVESSETPFKQLLQTAVDQSSSAARSSQNFILFGVDDCLFFNTVPLADAVQVLCDGGPTGSADRPFCVHFKLHPGIQYSHTRDCGMTAPSFFSRTDGVNGPSLLLWNRMGGATLDWNYPFELCASLYRADDVAQLVHAMTDEQLSHPNLLELHGNQLIDDKLKGSLLVNVLACCATPCCAVVTVNRVQDKFLNPVYTGNSDASSPEQLIQYWRQRKQYNLDYYKKKVLLRSVHIKDFEIL